MKRFPRQDRNSDQHAAYSIIAERCLLLHTSRDGEWSNDPITLIEGF
jgi:hypothetical protein